MKKMENVIKEIRRRRDARRILKETLGIKQDIIKSSEKHKEDAKELGFELSEYEKQNYEKMLLHADRVIEMAKEQLKPNWLMAVLS